MCKTPLVDRPAAAPSLSGPTHPIPSHPIPMPTHHECSGESDTELPLLPAGRHQKTNHQLRPPAGFSQRRNHLSYVLIRPGPVQEALRRLCRPRRRRRGRGRGRGSPQCPRPAPRVPAAAQGRQRSGRPVGDILPRCRGGSGRGGASLDSEGSWEPGQDQPGEERVEVAQLAGLRDGPARGGADRAEKEGDQAREEFQREQVVTLRRAL